MKPKNIQIKLNGRNEQNNVEGKMVNEAFVFKYMAHVCGMGNNERIGRKVVYEQALYIF